MWRLMWPGVVALLFVTGFTYAWLARFGSTPPFTGMHGKVVDGSIAEFRQMTIGGVQQWVLIRGRDAKAPILIWLSGGPGFDETFLLRRFDSALEDRFVVVYWTQRGAGRSYDSAAPTSVLTVARFVEDLDDLITQITVRLHRKKVILVGHSWGTAFGTLYAAKHPERVAAYVGTGQMSDAPRSEVESYDYALDFARRTGNQAAIAALTKMGRPPLDSANTVVQRKWLNETDGGNFHAPRPLVRSAWDIYAAPEATWYDLYAFFPSGKAAIKALWPEIGTLNLEHEAPRLDVPVIFLLGRYDHQVSASLAAEYFGQLQAPFKRLVWFEHSAHSPPLEEPQKFQRALITALRDAGVLPPGAW